MSPYLTTSKYSVEIETEISPNLIKGKIKLTNFLLHFQHSLSIRNGFISSSTQHLSNVLHVKFLSIVVAIVTFATKKHPKNKT